MSSGQQVTYFTVSRYSLYSLWCILLAVSCTVPKKYALNKPFVYKTTIDIQGKTPDYDRQELIDRLKDQVDDSLQVRVISYAGVLKVLQRPPVFDSLNIGRSKIFMTNLLNSLGYFQPVVTDTFYTDTVTKYANNAKRRHQQQRVNITFRVTPGIVVHIDSVSYALETPELQSIALRSRKESLLKRGQPYSVQKAISELDRLIGLYRDSGFYKITKENIFIEPDTVVAALIDPDLDPFEQIQLLDSLRRKREKPTINLTIKQWPVKDSSHITKYYMGNVRVFPDMSILDDSSYVASDSTVINGYKILYSTRQFKLPFIANNINLRPGSLYSQRRYFRTINTFNQLGAWQNVDLSLRERKDSVPLLDADLRLYPARKFSLNVDEEISRNVSDFLTQGQYFGVGLNFRLLNRNAYREAIQTSTNARFGIEVGTQLVQTLQASLSHNIYFPKTILPKFILDYYKDRRERKAGVTERTFNSRTFLNLNATYTDRRDFFRTPSFNTAWGYEWSRRKLRSSDPDNATQRWTKTYQLTPFNFEFANVNKTDSLVRLEQKIPAYRFAFNDGLIISSIFSISATRQFNDDKKLMLLRARIEESGGLTGLINKLELGDLRRFVKIDGEFKHYINYKKSSWAFRAFGGVAFIYGKADTGNGKIVNEHNLPFFKAFYVGGPYSMRAWQVRRLGPGSSTIYDPNDTLRIDRFGNMQLEFNAEYRFNITTIAGIKVNSALFVDIGNIWSKEFDPTTNAEIPEASFKLNRLYKDLALGAGSSLRLDFDFFMIRLDWAYRLKNPRYANKNNGWFQHVGLTDGQLQLGIGYPF